MALYQTMIEKCATFTFFKIKTHPSSPSPMSSPLAIMGVIVVLGQTVLTLIPLAASSRATHLAKCRSAALLVEYAEQLGMKARTPRKKTRFGLPARVEQTDSSSLCWCCCWFGPHCVSTAVGVFSTSKSSQISHQPNLNEIYP